MALIVLTQGEQSILGSDGLLWVDGRLSLTNVKHKVRERNTRYQKNFPHKIADGFYLVTERLEKRSNIIKVD